ncbi:hypothetical protein F511_09257 [Dorcoceras hygrometricum]|uniref:Splicing factor 3B subunit 1-like n=1 Tax=Dorcoceras hygrometricum TaxID=472368 RepID=A0A2Z7CQJ9_9LAMI|nr:hypothetical protein F511_09257 [Dorcoceras hygrometricum]
MASSSIANSLQVNFDSVLNFPEERMVKMFKDLESIGLRGFSDAHLFCMNKTWNISLALPLLGKKVISVVQGKFVGISEEQFSGAFGLPIAGFTDMTEVPKDLVYDARSIFSASGEPVKTSCKKREIKFEFRLLNDILEKFVTIKAGSFDAITHERFLLMTANHFGLKINWSKILFDILMEMGAPNLNLGEAKTFPPLKILTVKTIGTYVSKKKHITSDMDEPMEKMVKKAAAKRRPAPAVVEPIAKKKRTTVGREAPTEKNLEIVPVVQNPEAISVVLTETSTVEDVETDLEEPVVTENVVTDLVETESRIDVSDITNYDEEEPLVETETEKENDTKKEATVKRKSVAKIIDSIDTETLSKIPEEMMLPSVTAAEPTKIKFGRGIEIRERDWYKESLSQIDAAEKDIVAVGPVVDRSAIPKIILNDVQHRIQVEGFCDFFVQQVFQNISSNSTSESVESIRMPTPEAIPANSSSSRSSSSSDSPMHFTTDDIPLDDETTADTPQIEETPDVQISLPPAGVPSIDYTESFAQLRATVDKILLSKAVLVQTNILRKEMQDQKATLSEELADIHKALQDQKAAIANDFLEFIVETQENYNTLRAHLAEIIAYINRGRDDKKGEVRAFGVHSLLTIKADLLVVELGANLQGKEVVDLTEEEEVLAL